MVCMLTYLFELCHSLSATLAAHKNFLQIVTSYLAQSSFIPNIKEILTEPSPTIPINNPQKEVLTTRWANEDPNPTQILAVKRAHMNAFEKAAIASWEALPEEQKRARIQQLQMADALKTGRAISDYPSTDMQVGVPIYI